MGRARADSALLESAEANLIDGGGDADSAPALEKYDPHALIKGRPSRDIIPRRRRRQQGPRPRAGIPPARGQVTKRAGQWGAAGLRSADSEGGPGRRRAADWSSAGLPGRLGAVGNGHGAAAAAAA